MCDTLDAINVKLREYPSLENVHMALLFLKQARPVFEPSIWSAVSGSWDVAESRLLAATSPQEFLDAWNIMYLAIKTGACLQSPARYAITQTPADGPWGGRAVCAPTREPYSQTMRTYTSRGECEMGLQLLDPQFPAVPITSTVTCGSWGCDENVSWAPKPSR